MLLLLKVVNVLFDVDVSLVAVEEPMVSYILQANSSVKKHSMKGIHV
jgi:hypothetical protein